ncbi:hypothetical protein M407DRAFT_244986 [Tulasnella calospora MUT 4182]|uniref:Uncharacterized protein n=1 Tax=Tulasnella calospora MUT 4182 TaxID=1051891 RepID=A0A0C3LNI8_9AGAM|nr:hypothetical protein M407DRAFT_244983 [Tulasnella calospora MUT 4182]KIO22936.1 hypothetical protein M407DRAFT_244986 [Tulasnella calospora MUT 4182]
MFQARAPLLSAEKVNYGLHPLPTPVHPTSRLTASTTTTTPSLSSSALSVGTTDDVSSKSAAAICRESELWPPSAADARSPYLVPHSLDLAPDAFALFVDVICDH